MSAISSSILGFFFGIFFGAGCALALMYAIYTGGYRKAVEDSLREEKSDAWRRWLPYVEKRLRKEQAERGAKAAGCVQPIASAGTNGETIENSNPAGSGDGDDRVGMAGAGADL